MNQARIGMAAIYRFGSKDWRWPANWPCHCFLSPSSEQTQKWHIPAFSLALSGTYSQAATVKDPLHPPYLWIIQKTVDHQAAPLWSNMVCWKTPSSSMSFPLKSHLCWLGISSLPYSMTPDLQDPNPRNFQVFPLSRGFGGFRAFIAFPNKCNRLAHIWHLKATLLQKVGIGQETSHFQWCRSATFPGMFFFWRFLRAFDFFFAGKVGGLGLKYAIHRGHNGFLVVELGA